MAPLILDNFGLVLLNNLIHFIIEVEGNLGLSDPSLFTNKNQGSLEILRNLPNIPLLLNSKPGVEFQGYLVQSSSGPWVSSRDALSTGFTPPTHLFPLPYLHSSDIDLFTEAQTYQTCSSVGIFALAGPLT